MIPRPNLFDGTPEEVANGGSSDCTPAQSAMIPYEHVCFIIMPFGKKTVGPKLIDFDAIYSGIFEPAVSRVQLPEGGHLEARRTDMDFFSGSIDLEMFHYLEYSRIALADTSGLNPNVFYELGARHRARASGTIIFHQAENPIPFDIAQIKAFPYEYEPEYHARQSRELITKVLSESLTENRLDSPIRIALAAQQSLATAEQRDIESRLRRAENFLRMADWNAAIQEFRGASQAYPLNPLIRMRLGLLLRDRDNWREALTQFEAAISLAENYSEAWREKGVAENKLASNDELIGDPAPGENALRRALVLNPNDFDALASLGGILKRAGRLSPALQAYRDSTELSNGHPYPLLNSIKMQAYLEQRLDLNQATKRLLGRAEHALRTQIAQTPPYNAPWCFFDLAELVLFQQKQAEFMELAKQGLSYCSADWQPRTWLTSLKFLRPAARSLPGLEDGIRIVSEYLSS